MKTLGLRLFLLVLSGMFLSPTFAQQNLLHRLLRKSDKLFSKVLEAPGKYEVQIIYTQIDRNKNNEPHFKSFTYGLDSRMYFYPASTVKMPTAFAALEKVNKLKISGLNKYSVMKHGVGFSPQTPAEVDTSSESALPSIAHYIKKVFLVSDNDAHNRLYEFAGQEYLNNLLWSKGFKNVRLIHRLSLPGFDLETNKHTNPVSFFQGDTLLYYQGPVYSQADFHNEIAGQRKGKGYFSGGKLIEQPFDFSEKNFVSLTDLTGILKTVLFPNSVPSELRFHFSQGDYDFLYMVLSELPSESRFPDYNGKPDNYVKFFMFGDRGDSALIPKSIRIFNKVGWAYGFLTDVAYIVDFENKIEFMLSATIHVNEDGIFNDDKYEYDSAGLPFLANLGRVVYEFEKKRKRKYAPDLSRFRVKYD